MWLLSARATNASSRPLSVARPIKIIVSPTAGSKVELTLADVRSAVTNLQSGRSTNLAAAGINRQSTDRSSKSRPGAGDPERSPPSPGRRRERGRSPLPWDRSRRRPTTQPTAELGVQTPGYDGRRHRSPPRYRQTWRPRRAPHCGTLGAAGCSARAGECFAYSKAGRALIAALVAPGRMKPPSRSYSCPAGMTT